MKQYIHNLKYVIMLMIIFGMVLVLNLSRSSATTSLSFKPATNSLAAYLVLKPTAEKFTAVDLHATAAILEERLTLATLNSDFTIDVQDDYITLELANSRALPYVRAFLTHVGHIALVNGQFDDTALGQPSAQFATVLANDEVVAFTHPSQGDMFYALTITSSAEERLTALLSQPTQPYLCMALDETVVNCSSMYHWDGDGLAIVPNLGGGSLTMSDLIIFAKSGPLPLSLQIIE